MKIKNYTQTLYIYLLILLISPVDLKSQVTIGSNIQSNSGALLDLKEKASDVNNINATRGLVLPRLHLTDKYNLYPMFETSPGSNIPVTEYKDADKASQDAIHTGLIVYNMNKCNGFGQGTYVWVGKEWKPLTDVQDIISTPEISITNPGTVWIDKSTLLIHLPSGKDLRTFPSNKKFSLNLDWTNSDDGTLRVESTNETIGGGLKFANGSHPSLWPPATVSPVSYDYYIDDMSDIITSNNSNESNPFRSRETAITLETPLDICNEKTKLTIRLNQTNYRLTIKRENKYFNDYGYRFREESTKFNSGVNYYRFLLLPNYSGTSISGFSEESNARWNAQYEEITPGILVPDIVSDVIPSRGGKELMDGTFASNNRVPGYISPASAKDRYKEAGVLIYTDTATTARYYPIEIHFVQCVNKGYDDSMIETANTNENQWGSKVLKHTDRNGNTFYSAHFGNAGRWMTTNLAATTYDEGSGREGEDLDIYQTIDLQEHDNGKRKFAYPLPDSSGEPTNWGIRPADWRSEEGVFYNWYAATGRAYNDNDNNREGAHGNDTYAEPAIVQGICPKGWYLPSDSEWTQLEQEIYNNIDKYAAYDQIDIDSWKNNLLSNTWSTEWNNNTTSIYRGKPIQENHIGHGAAMKDICPPTASASQLTAYSYLQGSKGYSKEYNSGGFNATLVGRIKATNDTGTADERKMKQNGRAWDANYWSRSQNTMGDAWLRGFQLSQGGVNRITFIKTHLLSVRCKKK